MKDVLFWTRRFVMIYGIIMICTFSCAFFFNPTSELPVVSFFGRIIVFTLLGMATLIVYYSKEELTRMVVSYHTAFCDFRGSLSSIGTFGMES